MTCANDHLLIIGVSGAGRAIVGRLSDEHPTEAATFRSGPTGAQSLPVARQVVVVVGLGGHTGGLAAITEVFRAKARGAKTTVLAVLPFSFEGRLRQTRAQASLAALREAADAVHVFANDDLTSAVSANESLKDAYRICDGWMWLIISDSMGEMCVSKNQFDVVPFSTEVFHEYES